MCEPVCVVRPCGMIGRRGGGAGLGEAAGRMHTSAAAQVDPQPERGWRGGERGWRGGERGGGAAGQ